MLKSTRCIEDKHKEHCSNTIKVILVVMFLTSTINVRKQGVFKEKIKRNVTRAIEALNVLVYCH